MCEHINELKSKLAESGRSVLWLSRKTGMTQHHLYYILNHGKSISLSDYSKLMTAIENAGNELPEAENVSEASLRFSAVVNQELSDLQRKVLEALADGKISAGERKLLSTKVDQLGQALHSQIAELKEILKRG